MSYRAKNNAYSTLASGISAGVTSLTLQAGHGDRFPVISAPDWTKVTLEDAAGNREVIKVEARTAGSDILASLTRGQEGTTARAWNAGDVVELRMTAALVEEAMAHWAENVGAHNASAIAVSPAGNLAANDVQEALEELDAEKQPALGFTPANDVLGNLANKATARANIGIEAAEIDVASAATVDLGALAGMNARITGTTTIASFGTAAAGVSRNIRMADALVLTYNATSMILPGGANIATAAGDAFEALSLGSGNWFIRGYQRLSGQPVASVSGVPTGAVTSYDGVNPPSGWIWSDGKTIGSASSGATNRANADCEALFKHYWDNFPNSVLAVSGGRGVSASADWSANKTIVVPDRRGRVDAGQDDMGGTAASRLTSGGSGVDGATLGAVGGTETHTLTAAQSGLPAHTHSASSIPYQTTSGASVTSMTLADGTGAYGITIYPATPASASSAHPNVQPTLVTNKIIKL